MRMAIIIMMENNHEGKETEDRKSLVALYDVGHTVVYPPAHRAISIRPLYLFYVSNSPTHI